MHSTIRHRAREKLDSGTLGPSSGPTTTCARASVVCLSLETSIYLYLSSRSDPHRSHRSRLQLRLPTAVNVERGAAKRKLLSKRVSCLLPLPAEGSVARDYLLIRARRGATRRDAKAPVGLKYSLSPATGSQVASKVKVSVCRKIESHLSEER